MTENVRGIFTLNLGGSEKELKCTIGVVEHLERQVFKRPILQVISDALNGSFFISEVVETIIAGLHANKDTRLSKEEVGQIVLEQGVTEFLEFYAAFLTYSVTGNKEPEFVPVFEDQKKN